MLQTANSVTRFKVYLIGLGKTITKINTLAYAVCYLTLGYNEPKQ